MDLHAVAMEPEQYPVQTATSPGQLSGGGLKARNSLGLKLQISAPPANEANRVLWTLDTPDESSPTSLSPQKDARSDDSGFSSDENAQFLIEKISKLGIFEKEGNHSKFQRLGADIKHDYKWSMYLWTKRHDVVESVCITSHHWTFTLAVPGSPLLAYS
ncbi:unnamed protein product [Gongylonema pulchrum]|uniref:TBC1 domain family member 2B n=1 Tax=Gongylonema pulchrum TaxID=637853 RepID=A0A183DBL1_9BILA|nr:unnamed protein product [Gongylonema pulchrum]